ncbi:hypothetical protein [Desulfosporosinus sp. OT]|uniref:hypothetical protein n=1 Tax=Desulfosporosinus sp. OT TaxID=913865 RepID=UPI000223B18B|nr:hypothetical protein [Desulfosporosinus sp. OT]EGW41622.1 hypothetical protein DOT_0390 [Desulfosporosinus sp. OT]
MAKHEFGIFEIDPAPETSYDTYEPEKYNCIAVDDDYIEPLLGKLSTLDTYFHSVSRPDKGLAYTGITIIPPPSLSKFKKIIDSTDLTELQVLSKKIDKAIQKHKSMIHYGI